MKTKIILSIMLSIFLAVNLHAGSGDSEATTKAKQELVNRLYNMMYKVPFDDIIGNQMESSLMITFNIDDQAQLTVAEITGDNQELVAWATSYLYNKKITTDPVLKGRQFRIPVVFINERL